MGWMITLGVLVLLAILPLGVSAIYDANGALVRLILGPLRITVFPLKKKEKKPKKEAKEEKQTEPEPKAKEKPKKKPAKQGGGGGIRDFLPLVQVLLDFLGDFRRKLRVDCLEMKLILAGDDPADLGINYGRACAALGNLWPRLERLFVIKKRDVRIECDFTADKTLITARLDLTITLGRIIALVAVLAFRALKELLIIYNKRKGGATT